MSNKTDLQDNNKRIEDFIAEGQELPPAMPSELGNATPADVMNGKTFTSNGGVMQTGNLAPDGFGDATPADVMSGKTFSTDEGIRQTGSLAPNGFGDAAAEDVLIGRTFTSALGIMMAGGLDPDTLKQGKYVWKKYSASGKTGTISVEFLNDDYLTDHWEKVVQVSGNLTTSDLTTDDFIGLKMPCQADSGMHYIIFRADGKCEGIWGGITMRQGTYTYDSSSGKITVYAQYGSGDSFAGSIEITKRDFLGYVLSDTEDAYPDGGEQNGYWYERYDASSLRKITTGTITLPSAQSKVSIEHGLGEVPTHLVIVNDGSPWSDYVWGVIYPMQFATMRRGSVFMKGIDLIEGTDTEDGIDASKFEIDISPYRFINGKEYTWIAMV